MRGFGIVVLWIVLLSLSVLAEASVIATQVSGQDVQFSTSLNNVVSYAWDFDNDGKVDSAEATPKYSYPKDGIYYVNGSFLTKDNETIRALQPVTINVPLSVSATANPPSGVAPLVVQFTAIATGKDPTTYAWDFNGDGVIDATTQNPVHQYDLAGNYNATVLVQDGAGKEGKKTVPIIVQSFDSHIKLVSFFPQKLALGENQVSLLLLNEGKEVLHDLNGRVVGTGIQYLSSTAIPTLKPGDQDTLTLKMNIVQSGDLSATIKVLDKNFPVTFPVAEQVTYNKDELQKRYLELKNQLQEQESVYYDKKSEGYLVTEIFDNIKLTQKQLQDTQQQILTNRLSDANLNLELTGSVIADISQDLSNAKQQKTSFMTWLKENAVAITAIAAAMGALGGFLIKLKHHASKLTANVQKIVKKERKKEEEKEEPKV